MRIENIRPNPEVISYMTIRRAIGILGISLPIVLLIGGYCLGCKTMMPSISHYYYTYLVTVFTGTLCAVGLFLISYKGFSLVDDRATNFAGMCAFGIALFPTDAPGNGCSIYSGSFTTPPPAIHFTFAAMFFVTLGLISIFLFTQSSGYKTPEKIVRNRIYRICGFFMLLFVALIALIDFTPLKTTLSAYNPTFCLEALSLWSFGISWLTKGELISGDRKIQPPPVPEHLK